MRDWLPEPVHLIDHRLSGYARRTADPAPGDALDLDDGGESLPRAGSGRLDGGAAPDGDAAWDYWAKQADNNRI